MPPEVVLTTLKHAWTILEELNVPMAVMGGIALSAWKHVRATQDVDLLIGVEDARVDELVQRLVAARLRPKREPPVMTLGRMRLIQFLYEPPGSFLELQVDVLLATCQYQRAALARRVSIPVPGLDIDVFVLACEDLILHKILAGRIIDRVDCAALLRANRSALALDYLGKWARELNVISDLSEIWSEAFPQEQTLGELIPD